MALGVALFLPVQRDLFHSNNWRLELLRGLCLLGTTAANFLAMRYLLLTVTGALLFTMPLMVTAHYPVRCWARRSAGGAGPRSASGSSAS